MTTTTAGQGGKRPGAGRKPGNNATFQAAKARKETALAELRSMEVAEKQRRLIPAAEVEEVVGTAFAAVAQALLALSDNLERRAGLTPDQAEKLEAVIHEVMTDLSDRLSVFKMDSADE